MVSVGISTETMRGDMERPRMRQLSQRQHEAIRAAGKPHKLTTEELHKEIQSLEGIIRGIANFWKSRNRNVDYRELLQEVTAGFLHAGKKYDKRGKFRDGEWIPTLFQTYATYWGNYYGRLYALGESTCGFHVARLPKVGFKAVTKPSSLNAMMSFDHRDSGDVSGSVLAPAAEETVEEGFWEAVEACLPKTHWKVVQARFRCHELRRIVDIVDIVGLSKERVRQILHESIEILRENPALANFAPGFEVDDV